MPLDEKNRALLALVLLVPVPSIGVLAAMWIFPGGFGQALYGLCKLWLVAFPLVWWLCVDRGKISWSPLRNGGLTFGALSGLAIAVTIAAAYWILGDRFLDPERMREVAGEIGLDTQETYLAFAAYLTLANSLFEEYIWRWFVYRKSETLMGPRIAAFATAGFFTIHHALALHAQLGWSGAILGGSGTFVGSLVWSWCYRRYGSIWPAYLSHIFADVAVFAVGWTVIFNA